jgi:hypothetical protein
MAGGQGKVDRDMEIGITDDEQAKVCHDKVIGTYNMQIDRNEVTGHGWSRVDRKRSVTQAQVLQVDGERFAMTMGLIIHADR